MKRVYESPEFEIEKFKIYDSKVFTITVSEKGFDDGGDTEEEW